MAKVASDTKTGILKVALQLFLKKGYKDVSYSDLIAVSGLSKGAIYHHFKSKEELLASVFEYMIETGSKPVEISPEKEVKDFESFRKVFIKSKKLQFENFKKLLDTESVKFNKLLFFLEAINENEKLKKLIMEILKQETFFLEKCFSGLKKHGKLPKGKDVALLAESLFWMLQGTEMLIFFINSNVKEKDFMKMYDKTITDFFKII